MYFFLTLTSAVFLMAVCCYGDDSDHGPTSDKRRMLHRYLQHKKKIRPRKFWKP